MRKVYTYPKKIFKVFGVLALAFGVASCASSQSTVTQSGETDGIYYSPSKDGQLAQAQDSQSNDYDIKVGSPYFDADGNGAEDFYYEDTADATANENINIDTGYSNGITLGSGATTDWGRYDGLDITINNYGYGWYGSWYSPWYTPYWGYNNYWGWGYPGWRSSWYYGWGWGGYWGYPYWGGYYNSYWGWGSYYPYYGGYGYYGQGYYGYYNRGTAIQPGRRPGSNLAMGATSGRDTRRPLSGSEFGSATNSVRSGAAGVRSTPASGLTTRTEGTRPVRGSNTTNGNIRGTNNVRSSGTGQVTGTRTNGNVRQNAPVRQNNSNVRENNSNVRQNTTGVTRNPDRPVRATPPQNVRPNTPQTTSPRGTTTPRGNMGTNPGMRSNTPAPRSNPGTRSTAPAPRGNSGMRSNTPPRSSSGSYNSGGSMRSSGSGGGMRSSGGTRGGGRR